MPNNNNNNRNPALPLFKDQVHPSRADARGPKPMPSFKDQVRPVDPEEQGRREDPHPGRADARGPKPMPSFKDQAREGAGGPSSPLRAPDIPSPAFKDQVRDGPLQRRQHVPKTREPVFEGSREFEAQNNTRRENGVGAQAVAYPGNANRDRDTNEEESQSTSTTSTPPARTIEAELVQRPVEAEAVHPMDEKRKYLLGALFSITALLVIGGVVVGAVCGTGKCSGGGGSNNSLLVAPAPCDVDVTLDCQTLDGRSCAGIGPPYTASCIDGSGGDILVLKFSYQNETQCNSTSNTQGSEAICVDNAPLVAEPVDVRCSPYTPYGDLCVCCTGNSELTVAPETVYPGDIFAVTDPNGRQLPPKLECIIFFEGNKLQTNVIDTSGTVGLNLGDKFGSLQVETCDTLTCLETVRYIVQISNVGGDPVFVTNMDLTTPNDAGNLTDLLQQDSLSPGEAIFVERRVEINTCSGLEFSSQVHVGANLTNGEMLCQGSDEFTFKVTPLPPLPTNPPAFSTNAPSDSCVISLTADCLFTGDSCFSGLSCSIPYIGGFDPCLPPPDSVVMIFTGKPCSGTNPSTRQQGAFSCNDFNGGPPKNEGDQAHILVEDDSTVYYDGVVILGELIPSFSTNSGLMQNITISTPDNRTVLQEMRYHSSCLQDLSVDYGALQLVTRTVIETPFLNGTFQYGVNIPITGFGDNVTLTSLTMQTNFAGDIDLTDQVAGQTAGPSGNVVVTLEGSIEVSGRQRYIMFYNVEGARNADGELCTGTDMISFEAGSDG